MKRVANRISIFHCIVISMLCISCNNSKISTGQTDGINNNSKELKGEFKFARKFFDFGVIKDGDTVRHTFTYKNIGVVPLIIHDISVSCGCTVVSYSKMPVKPHEEGFVNVQFSKHHDPGKHSKLIIIKANTDNPYTVLSISATINPPKNPISKIN